MAIRRKAVGDVAVLYLEGGFYGGKETDDLEEAIKQEAANGNTRLILNMTECRRLSSLAIGVLLQGDIEYRRRGGKIKLCGASKPVMDAFVKIRMPSIFEFCSTEEEAIAAFGASG